MALDNVKMGSSITQGKYQLSIGTSLALETLFGINDNVAPTNPLPYKKYTYIMFNIRTLIRNIYGAILKEMKVEYPAQKYLDLLLKELEMIPLVLDDQSSGRLNAIFYISAYRSLEKEFPHAILKKVGAKAYGSQHYEAIEQYCIAHVTKLVVRGELTVAMVDTFLHPIDQPCGIITHMPIDLIPYTASTNVDLIETHTGAIKGRNLWYTKLSGSGLERIPFDKWSIQWFGDGKLFSAYPPKYRKAVITLAEDNRWNQTTTTRLIKVQTKRIPDAGIRDALNKLI